MTDSTKMEVLCIDVGATYEQYFVNIEGLCYIDALKLIVCIAEEFTQMENNKISLNKKNRYYLTCHFESDSPPALWAQLYVDQPWDIISNVGVCKVPNNNDDTWIIVIAFESKHSQLSNKSLCKLIELQNKQKQIKVQQIGSITQCNQIKLFSRGPSSLLTSAIPLLQFDSSLQRIQYKLLEFREIDQNNISMEMKNRQSFDLFPKKDNTKNIVWNFANEIVLPIENCFPWQKLEKAITHFVLCPSTKQLAITYVHPSEQYYLLQTFQLFINEMLMLSFIKFTKIYSIAYIDEQKLCCLTEQIDTNGISQKIILLINAKTLVPLYRFSSASLPHFTESLFSFANLQLTLFLITPVMVYAVHPNGQKINQQFYYGVNSNYSKIINLHMANNRLMVASYDKIYLFSITYKQQEEPQLVEKNYMAI